jgi:hypothetical protein
VEVTTGRDPTPIFKGTFYISCFDDSRCSGGTNPYFKSPGSRNVETTTLQSMSGFDLIWMVTMNLNVFRGFSHQVFSFLFSRPLYFKVPVAEMVTRLN